MDYLEKIMISEFYEEMAVLENHENIFDIFDTWNKGSLCSPTLLTFSPHLETQMKEGLSAQINTMF